MKSRRLLVDSARDTNTSEISHVKLSKIEGSGPCHFLNNLDLETLFYFRKIILKILPELDIFLNCFAPPPPPCGALLLGLRGSMSSSKSPKIFSFGASSVFDLGRVLLRKTFELPKAESTRDERSEARQAAVGGAERRCRLCELSIVLSSIVQGRSI